MTCTARLAAWTALTAPSARLALRSAVGVALTTPQFIAASLALKSAWAGLLAGCLHTLTGPDHLAALAPLSVGPNRAKNAAMGALWGLGHNTGQILFGLIFVLLKDKLPFNMEIIGQWGQGIVGGTLVIIGIMGWWEARAMARGESAHSHSHSHGLPFGIGGVSSAGGSAASRRFAASASALMRARSRSRASSRAFASAASRFSFSARSRRAVEASRDSLSGGLTTTLSFRSGWAGAQRGMSPKELSESESSAIVGSGITAAVLGTEIYRSIAAQLGTEISRAPGPRVAALLLACAC